MESLDSTPIKRNFGLTFGRTAEGRDRDYAELEKRLAEQETRQPKPSVIEPIITQPAIVEQKKDYVYVPALGLYISENKYLPHKKWNQVQEILHQEGRRMPTIPEFVEFLKYLKSVDGKAKVKNAQVILDGILKVGTCYRAEWLDAEFKEKKGMYVSYHVFDSKGKIVQKTEQLDECLMNDRKPGIDLDSWLNNPNKQGLPKADVADGTIWYWFPGRDNNSVARFNADSDRALLNCCWNPTYAIVSLGVRFVEKK